MPPVKPMLGDIELQLVQEIEVDSDQVLIPHSVPALEGDLLQGLDRRAVRITLSGVLVGPEAGVGLKELREKFRAAEPVPFVADIATATRVDPVLIEEMGVREVAGRPERFEYAFTLREYIPPPAVTRETPPETPTPESPAEQIDQGVGSLAVEVTVEGQPEFDFSHVTVTVEGTQTDGTSLSRTLTNRADNLWTEENFPAGSYTVRAAANPRPLSGLAQTAPQSGQSTQVSVALRPTSNLAKTFIIHFRFDKAFVEPCMRPVLQQAAKYASDHNSEKLVIVGHTDKAGSPDYNQSLSERRARAVFAFFSVGVDQAARDVALAEWGDIRQKRPASEPPSIKDSWGAREYQHMLQDLGFYPGPVDGKHGPLTDEAVSAYRCHKGLPPGTTVDDDVWKALIEDYLTKEALAVPVSQFFPNCQGEILKWLGCGEEDPLDRKQTAFRPSRRAELMFVQTDRLPCEIPQPATFELPEKGRVNKDWCAGPKTAGKRCCLVSPHFKAGTNDPVPCTAAEEGPWCRHPVEPGTITVQGSIQREKADGSLESAGNQAFVLIAPNGRFKADEQSNGEPTAARTKKDGTFSFPDMPLGFYSLEVVAPDTAPVLVRLLDKTDADIRGNAVCKALRSDQDRLDVVIVHAPVLREIRLQVVVHLMTALHPATRAVRTCPDPLNPATRVPQKTKHTADEVKKFFEGANGIWRQARVRFELDSANIVQESYSFRTECDVDTDEFALILDRCAYQKAVNVFFFADLAGQVEAGVYVKAIVTDVRGTVDGCAVSDKFQFAIFTPAPNVDLDDTQTVQVLAHELGHYLSLEHVEKTTANADRLMLPGSISGENRTLGKDEVEKARASPNAKDSCVPLSLKVSGATKVGGDLSDKFIVVQNPGGVVTVDAQIPDQLLDPARGALAMTGGDPGDNDRQRRVNAAATGEAQVVATYTPAGAGQPVISRVVIRVATFTLGVDGAIQASAGSTTFVAKRDAAALITVTAEIDPAPFCVPSNLVVWVGGTEVPDPLRRTVPRAAIAQTAISATMAGVTRTVTIRIIDVALTSNAAPFDAKIATVRIEGVLNSNLKSFDMADVIPAQRDSLFRARADIPGVAGNTIQARLIRRPLGGAAPEARAVTLTRTGGDRFVSRPVLAVPEVIGGEIVFKAPQDIEAVRARAGDTIQLVVDGDFANLALDQVIVRGMVVFIFARSFDGSGISAADIRRHIQRANRVWAQAGLEFKERSVRDGVAAPDGLLNLDHDVPFSGTLTAEEKILCGISPNGPARSGVATDLNVYYVETINGPAAGVAYSRESFREIAAPAQTAIAAEITSDMAQDAADAILAHETGHHLLVNWGGDEHQDHAGTNWPDKVIMHPAVTDQRDVDRTQVENILQGVRLGISRQVIFEP